MFRSTAWILPVILAFVAAPAVRPAAAQNVRQAARVVSPAMNLPLKLVQEAKEAYAGVRSYRCLFIKRDYVNGQLQPYQFILMKVRTRPFSVYMRWLKPRAGREVLYVPHRYGPKIIAHEVGVKGVVGTVEIDPHSARARKESRHPITEIGIGNMIRKLERRWLLAARDPQYSVEVKPNAKVGNRSCWCVKARSPARGRYEYFRVRVFFDKQHKLPIRFEGYSWPTRQFPDGMLIEEYTYDRLELNVPLSELDFDVRNPEYNF